MAEWIGQVVGNYRLETQLGAGGMGQVFLGTHIHLNRTAAVKVLHAQFAVEPAFQARFVQEARAIASLTHEHIVGVLDFGEQAGHFYLIMEPLTDGSLRTLRRSFGEKEPLPLLLALDLLRQAAAGLAFAHRRGFVHRDIKPDNLLLRRDAREAHGLLLKITDFGLVRLDDGGVQTQTGVTMGTPAYMSPEQCQGIPLDGRSDVYSLGVVLFESVTGRAPFEVRSLSDAVFRHVYTPPPSPLELRPDLPQPLVDVILRCLAKQADERFADAGGLYAALEQLIVSEMQQAARAGSDPAGTGMIGANNTTLVDAGWWPDPVQPLGTPAPAPAPTPPSTPPSTPPVITSPPNVTPAWVYTPVVEPDEPAPAPQVVNTGPPTSAAPWDSAVERVSMPPVSQPAASAPPTPSAPYVSQSAASAPSAASAAPAAPVADAVSTPPAKSRAPRKRAPRASSPASAAAASATGADAAVQMPAHAQASQAPGVGVSQSAAAQVSSAPSTPVHAPGPSTVRRHAADAPTAPPAAGGGSGGGGGSGVATGAPLADGRSGGGRVAALALGGVLALALVLLLAYVLTRPDDNGGGGDDANGVVAGAGAAETSTAAALLAGLSDDDANATGTVQALEAEQTATENAVRAATFAVVPTEAVANNETPEAAPTETPDPGSGNGAEPTPTEFAPIAVTPGAIVYASGRNVGDAAGALDLWTMEADGSGQQQLISMGADDWSPAWSPDGTMVAWVSKQFGNDDIWYANADGSNANPLTTDPADDRFPAWSPDGQWILFARTLDGNDELFAFDLNGGTEYQLTYNDAPDGYAAWAPDGATFAWASGESGNWDIRIYDTTNDSSYALTDDSADDFSPAWLPDGSKIVFVSRRDGNLNIYHMLADGSEQASLTTDLADEFYPRVSPDGGYIAFVRQVGDVAADSADLVLLSTTTGEERVLATNVTARDPGLVWSPDSTRLLFQREADDTYVDLWLVDIASGSLVQLTTYELYDGGATWRGTYP